MQDPAEPKSRIDTALLAGFGLLIAWLTFFTVWPLSALVVFAGGIALGFRSRRASLAMLLLSPLVVVPVLSLAGGTLGYLTGRGVLRGYGLPGPEYSNLDPRYRCPRTSSGCVVDGSEFLTHTPNNLAIQVLTSLFGPMPGAYAGPYPTREEALQAVRTAALHFLPSEIPQRAAALGVPPGPCADQLRRTVTGFLEADVPIAAAVFQQETILLGREKCLFLIERRTGRTYARYYFRHSARREIAEGDWDEALRELDHAVDVDPRNPDYLKERGDAHLQKGARESAAADYRKALDVAPADWWRRTEVETDLLKLRPSDR